jgi:tetratricopeptide (TPR) repeat protein
MRMLFHRASRVRSLFLVASVGPALFLVAPGPPSSFPSLRGPPFLGSLFFRPSLALAATSRPAATAIPAPSGRPSEVRGPGGALDDPFQVLSALELARLHATRGRPESIAPLLGLFELAQLGSPGALDGPVRELVDAPGGDPLVAARARDWLAERADAEGDATGATRLRGALGMLTHMWVVGPFGEGRSGFGVAFPPELTEQAEHDGQVSARPPDTHRAMPGKERAVSWRRAENASVRGALELEALLRPVAEGTAYLLAFVHVEATRTVALRLGTPGPVKVWCNGVLVHAADRRRPAHLDQDAIGMTLVGGWNRLLIKTVVGESSWRVYARLTTPDGGALDFRNAWAPGPAVPSTRGGRAVARSVPVRGLQSELVARIRAAARSGDARARAEAWLDLGRYLQATHPGDADQKEAAHAYAESGTAHPSLEAMLGAARVARDEDESRRMLEQALTLAEVPGASRAAPAAALDRARVLAALGDVAHDERRDGVALERWRAALAAAPSWWPASVSLAAEERAVGLPAAALERLAELPATVRAIPLVVRDRMQSLLALDRRAEAEAEARGLRAHAQADVDLSRELAGYARDRGRTTEAVTLLGQAARLRPDIPSFSLDWARACEGEGDAARAVEILTAAAWQLPDEPVLAAELGKLLERLGRATEGDRWLGVAMALRPQDAELRRYTDAVMAHHREAPGGASGAGPTDGPRDELPRRFALSAPTVLAEELPREVPGAGAGRVSSPTATLPLPPAAPPSALGASTGASLDPPSSPDEPDGAVVLLDRHVVRVHDNGLSETFAQRLVQVRTDAGAEENKEFSVRYTPGAEEVEILEARIYRRPSTGAGWEVIQVSERDDQDLSEPWYGLYYDTRAEIVRFEGLRAGDVIEIQYLLSDVSQENQMAGYFGDLEFVAEGVPKRRWDYILLGPPGRTFHVAKPVLRGLVSSESLEGGERVMRFSARNVPRVEIEPAMPGLAEVSPFLHVSTYGRAEDVGAWYWHLIAEQLKPDDTIRAAAESVVPARARARLSDLDKVRAVHAFVVGQTRYVGLEFGIHGFKPYKVSQVLARKFGDCKDKAALMVALLGEVGVDADMVLLRTRRGGRLSAEPPSLAGFDHAIAYIPKLDLYLDGTAEFSGVDELPSQDQGVQVLRVGPHGAASATTPILPSARNRASRRWTVALGTDGGADVREELTVSGQAASEWRQHYQTVGEQGERYGKVWSARNPGAHLLWVKMPGLQDRDRPVTVLARATVPRLAEPLPGGGMSLALGVRDGDLVRNYARLSVRRSDLLLAYPWQHDERVTYQLPAAFRVDRLPGSRALVTRFGRFDLTVERAGTSTVVVSSRLDVARARIAPDEYADFRRFLSDVDAIMRERVILAPPVLAYGGVSATAAEARVAVPLPPTAAAPNMPAGRAP